MHVKWNAGKSEFKLQSRVFRTIGVEQVTCRCLYSLKSDSHFKKDLKWCWLNMHLLREHLMVVSVCLLHLSHFPVICLSFSTSQGILITHNASARVIRSNQSLVLQKVTRNSSGNYSCSAINAEGETVSNQQPLRVKCECFFNSFFNVFNQNRFLLNNS